MTRDEALLKLLAIEPERRDRIRQITGWPSADTEEVLTRLEREGRVTSIASVCNCQDYRIYSIAHAQSAMRGLRGNARYEIRSTAA